MSRPMCPHMGDVGSGAIANNSSIATVIGYSKKLYDLTGRASSSSYQVSKREPRRFYAINSQYQWQLTSATTVKPRPNSHPDENEWSRRSQLQASLRSVWGAYRSQLSDRRGKSSFVPGLGGGQERPRKIINTDDSTLRKFLTNILYNILIYC